MNERQYTFIGLCVLAQSAQAISQLCSTAVERYLVQAVRPEREFVIKSRRDDGGGLSSDACS